MAHWEKDRLVYDRVEYHINENFPADLRPSQALVHTGLFFGWLLDNGMYSDQFERDSPNEIEAFRQRKATGPTIYRNHNGVLTDQMLNEEGNAFARIYFDLQRGKFIDDYMELLACDLPSVYHVRDTWENFNLLSDRIDRRYREWRTKGLQG